ncbi:leucine rich adaptor protein 1 [Dendropsophus ebraccatus]|uniref:leucine rich adaptor protein 1 n=1 Tax=Dendropsophus ebraccatus TaxID=150705 RepID=UPI003831D5CD
MEAAPDLRDLESKVGRKTPEGLLRWMREEPALRGGSGCNGSRSLGLGGKIEALRLELACLRAIDVQILQQLLLVNEGIEAVKWILEDKGALTSRCSSLTSSQYSLPGSQETSRRGSWNSLQDPADRLDSISIGSYLDTLADDMDEYSLSTSEPVVSSTPHRPTLTSTNHDDYMALTPVPRPTIGASKQQEPDVKTLEEQPKLRLGQNGRASSKVHLEYDAHWRWVQSQDDVTFL